MTEDAGAYLEAASQLLGLPIHPDHFEEVIAAFKVLREQAAMITEFSLPEHVEAAPRYMP